MDKIKAFRSDAIDKATGRAKYSADFYSHDMLYAKILWPPRPHIKVLKIDTSEAENAEGVYGIVTRKDITGPNLTGVFTVFDRPILVGEGEETQYGADALAIVAAETEDQAARAVDMIKVEYEELPAVFSADQAIAQNETPMIERSIKRGDIEKGWEEAKVTVELDLNIPLGEHAYIEPEGGYAYIGDNGVINVYAGTQDIIQNLHAVCNALDYPYNKVRLSAPYVGGAFGGKHLLTVQPYLVLAEQILQRPINLTWTREESISFSCKKQGPKGKVKIGLTADGKVCALAGRIDGSAGAYMANAGDNCFGVLNGMVGPYDLPNVDLEGYMWKTTDPEQGALRSVGAADGVLIFETLLTAAGRKLGLSQLEVRKRNWLTKPEQIEAMEPYLMKVASPEWPVEKLTDMVYEEAGELPKPCGHKVYGRGIGIAKASYAIGNTDYHSGSSTQIDMMLDGTVTVRIGFPELGQGVTAVAVFAASEALGIDPDRVNVIRSDSQLMPPAGAEGFSQATGAVSGAVVRASKRLKELLVSKAQACLDTDEDLEFRQDGFYSKEWELRLPWADFREYCYAKVEYLTATDRVRHGKETENEYGVTPVVCLADVEIDTETGEMKVLQMIQSHDIGRVIQPESARGQMLGAAVMNMGLYTMESFLTENGTVRTPSLAEYVIPSAMDIPQKNKILFLEGNLDPNCPFGAKGIGEHGMYTTAAAISNAIQDAIGVPCLHLPVTSEELLRAMGKL